MAGREVVLVTSNGTRALRSLPGGAGVPFTPDDLAMAARDAFRQNRGRLADALAEGRHARRLSELGLGEDVAYCDPAIL